MRNIKVRVHKSSENLKKEDQLAWKIAEIVSDDANNDNCEQFSELESCEQLFIVIYKFTKLSQPLIDPL